jgi:hypothetical protein
MKVVVSPRASQERGAAASVALALAGGGVMVSLAQAGVRTLKRPLSAAEVALMREALAGEEPVVGYVCRGASLPDARPEGVGGPAAPEPVSGPLRVVAVSDHVNLTWGSPLTGPNDASVGPRFPSMTGIYRPEVVLDRVGAAGGIIVDAGVVAGVRDDGRLTSYEEEVARVPDYLAVSEELVPVVIVAAHMGLRVAAAVVLEGS